MTATDSFVAELVRDANGSITSTAAGSYARTGRHDNSRHAAIGSHPAPAVTVSSTSTPSPSNADGAAMKNSELLQPP